MKRRQRTVLYALELHTLDAQFFRQGECVGRLVFLSFCVFGLVFFFICCLSHLVHFLSFAPFCEGRARTPPISANHSASHQYQPTMQIMFTTAQTHTALCQTPFGRRASGCTGSRNFCCCFFFFNFFFRINRKPEQPKFKIFYLNFF